MIYNKLLIHVKIIKHKISDLLIKMNLIINENWKNMEEIMNQISFLQNKINQINQNMNINYFYFVIYKLI